MDAYKIYKQIFSKWCGYRDAVGLNVLKDDWKFNMKVFLIIFTIIYGIICGVYTCLAYDMNTALKTFSTTCVLIQCIVKIYVLLKNRQELIRMVKFVERIYIESERTGNLERMENIRYWAKFKLNFAILLFGNLAMANIVVILNPVLYYFLMNEFILAFFIYVPYVNYEAAVGFIATHIFHVALALACTVVIIFFDSIHLILSISSRIMSGLIKHNYECINKQLKTNYREIEIVTNFRNTWLMHKEMIV